jgi:L-arabinokinase
MGGIADYSGSLVLQKPITQQTSVELILREDYRCIINSRLSTGEVLSFNGDYRNYLKNGEVDYVYAQHAFRQNPADTWAAYIVGCVLVLQKEKGIAFKGVTIELQSTVPNGKGVASSASVEIATMKALATAFNLSLVGTELPTLAQRVENLIVGAPCGLMDQLTSFFGEPNTLLPIICQPDQVQEAIDLPQDIFFVGIDSGIRHQVSGASYSDVRCAAFMGYTIIAQAMGVTKQDILDANQFQQLSTLPFKGYLSNINVDEFEERFQSLLPETLSGKDFHELYGETIDAVTIVDENKLYRIKSCTAHPVYENYRVHEFQQHLIRLKSSPEGERKKNIQHMGALMLASHTSYSECGLGTERTDEIVALAKDLKGIAGARITGGGNGGTVCILAHSDAGLASVKTLHNNLEHQYNENLSLFY